MSDKRWQRIEDLFHGALDLAPEARSGFLRKACGEDEALREEVQALLASNSENSSWLILPSGDSTPQSVAHYRIVAKLGQGGMGILYRATDTKLGRDVAIKVLPAAFACDPDRMARFSREAKMLASLNHPNIVAIYGVEDRALILELVPGKNLKGPLPVATALGYAGQIASALEAAHEKGIVHRDLKPANIRITPAGLVKVLDFGLAKAIEADPSVDYATLTAHGTETGAILGTPAYMAPEQACGEAVDQRADIWAFGVVLFEMLTGKKAFGGLSNSDSIAAVLTREPDFELLPQTTPEQVRHVLERCLRKDPKQRLQHIGDVRILLEEEAPVARAGKPVSRPSPAWEARRVGAAVLAVAVAAFAVTLLRSRKPAPVTEQAEMTVRPFLTSPTNETTPAFSPDGKTIAFSWDGEDGTNRDIYIKLLDAGNALRPTTDPAPDLFPSWSPDGKFVAFLRLVGPAWEAQILTVPALGRPERKLVDQRVFGPISWHPSGKSIAFGTEPEGERPGIFLLDLESGQQRRLTTVPVGALYDSSPVYSPDGKTLAFCRSRSVVSGSIMLLSIDDGSLRSFPDSVWGVGIAWMPDGRSVLVGGTLGNTAGAGPDYLRRVPLDSGSPSAIGMAGTGASSPSPSPDGRRVVYQQNFADNNIWHARLETPTRLGEPRAWISSSRLEIEPRYSPDGAHILFVSDRSGRRELWLADADGKNQQPLTTNTPVFGSPSWSPDGTRIVFDGRVNGNADIFLMSLGGGPPKRLTDGPAEDIVPSFSHDGRRIYFCSSRTGTLQLWRMPASGGAAEQITKDGGFDSQESRDEKYLYYSKDRDKPGLARRGPDGKEEMLLPDLYGRRWVVADKGIYYLDAIDRERRLRYLDLATRRITVIATIPKIRFATNRCIDISPDGRELLWVQIDSSNTDLMLIDNFH
jgi:eukaryotic-like serine/threonine-protein kinase